MSLAFCRYPATSFALLLFLSRLAYTWIYSVHEDIGEITAGGRSQELIAGSLEREKVHDSRDACLYKKNELKNDVAGRDYASSSSL